LELGAGLQYGHTGPADCAGFRERARTGFASADGGCDGRLPVSVSFSAAVRSF
jgi:hypothetical protein